VGADNDDLVGLLTTANFDFEIIAIPTVDVVALPSHAVAGFYERFFQKVGRGQQLGIAAQISLADLAGQMLQVGAQRISQPDLLGRQLRKRTAIAFFHRFFRRSLVGLAGRRLDRQG
jgi:hypothetical protein